MVDRRRVRVLKEGVPGTGPVVYVMAREERVSDNWALMHAEEEAHARGVPLVVLFVIGESFLNYSERHNTWLIASLTEVEQSLQKLQVPLFVRTGPWAITVAEVSRELDAALVVFDFNPLMPVRAWREEATKAIASPVHEVDAHNIIPCWVLSDKTEFAAYTIRPKVRKLYREFSGPIPKPKKQKYAYTGIVPKIDWDTVSRYRAFTVQAPMPSWIIPGEKAAKKTLSRFIEDRLVRYEHDRNDPTLCGQSDLSPYIRWGNIAAQRIAHEIEQVQGVSADAKKAFLEELVVRRELAENFVFYTKGYDTLAGAHAWAQKSLSEHRSDPREYVYSYEEFEKGQTHDALWNAAQMEMVKRGKMHGFMRMYWAKKILEWTKTPEDAIAYALKLNDTYELDGRDPNGVTGVMWSVAGVHDRAWFERPVFGKIRYMNENGCKRKFDVVQYIEYVSGL